MAKSQKKSGRETRKTKKAEDKPKSKLPRYLAESESGHVIIPTSKPTGKA